MNSEINHYFSALTKIQKTKISEKNPIRNRRLIDFWWMELVSAFVIEFENWRPPTANTPILGDWYDQHNNNK